MKNTVVNQVKKAASIVLCRSSQNIGSMYDYQILMLERKVLNILIKGLFLRLAQCLHFLAAKLITKQMST